MAVPEDCILWSGGWSQSLVHIFKYWCMGICSCASWPELDYAILCLTQLASWLCSIQIYCWHWFGSWFHPKPALLVLLLLFWYQPLTWLLILFLLSDLALLLLSCCWPLLVLTIDLLSVPPVCQHPTQVSVWASTASKQSFKLSLDHSLCQDPPQAHATPHSATHPVTISRGYWTGGIRKALS